MMPNSPKLTIAAAMLPFRNDGMEKRLKSSIDTWPRRLRDRSTRMKIVNAANPITNAAATGDTDHDQDQEPTVSGVVVASQPYVRPSIKPKTMPPKPTAESAAPSQSAPRWTDGSLDSGTSSSSPMITNRPSGMLIPNALRQENEVVSQPPSS